LLFASHKLTFVQLNINESTQFANVKYFFQLNFNNEVHSLALASIFSPSDDTLLKWSSEAVYVCHYEGDNALQVFNVKKIHSVVSMFLDYQVTPEGDIVVPKNQFSLLRHPYLELASLCREVDPDRED
jgi:hypothetical protein